MNAPPQPVLIVDDDPQFCQVLSAALRCAGAEPTIAGDMGSARVEWKRTAYPILLLDLTLPDSHPQMTVRTIPEILCSGVGMVVVITGSPLIDGLPELCRQWGASSVFAKDEDFLTQILALVKK